MAHGPPAHHGGVQQLQPQRAHPGPRPGDNGRKRLRGCPLPRERPARVRCGGEHPVVLGQQRLYCRDGPVRPECVQHARPENPGRVGAGVRHLLKAGRGLLQSPVRVERPAHLRHPVGQFHPLREEVDVGCLPACWGERRIRIQHLPRGGDHLRAELRSLEDLQRHGGRLIRSESLRWGLYECRWGIPYTQLVLSVRKTGSQASGVRQASGMGAALAFCSLCRFALGDRADGCSSAATRRRASSRCAITIFPSPPSRGTTSRRRTSSTRSNTSARTALPS